MPSAMSKIAEKAKDFGADSVITFTPIENTNSLRGCHFAGFTPYSLRIERWFFFLKSVEFVDLPQDVQEYYNKLTKRSH